MFGLLSEIRGTPQFFGKYLDILEPGERVTDVDYMERLYNRRQGLDDNILNKLRYLENHQRLGYDHVIIHETSNGIIIERVSTAIPNKTRRALTVA